MAATSQDGYAKALRLQILLSEQKRMRALAIVFAVLLAITTGFATIFFDLTSRMFPGGVNWWMPSSVIGPFILFEVLALSVLRWRMGHGLDFPQPARFANALIETSLPGAIIWVLADRMNAQLVFAFWPPMLYFVFIILSTLRLDFWLSVWTGLVGATQQYFLAAHFLPLSLAATAANDTPSYHLSRSVILLIGGIVAGVVALALRRQFESSVGATVSRDRVTNLFGQHVSPAVVERLLAQASDPPSEMRTVCVLFLDIRGFTAMTRKRTADETVSLLNDFFAEMIDVVDRHHGIINKFLGDGFLALFGAPLHDNRAAANALAAGQAMLAVVDGWNAARPGQPLKVGIGIHIGEAVTGTVGSPQRKEYTVIGDTVNLAARLEQLTKETGARLLVSDSVHVASGALAAQDLGPTKIRGYDEEVRVWRVA